MSLNLTPGRTPRVPSALLRMVLRSLVVLFLASALIASSEVTPEQILLLAKENLCFNFLRAPSPDVRMNRPGFPGDSFS